MFKERDYAKDARIAIFKEWETKRSTGVEMATGTGKTVLFTFVIKHRQPGRALVLAHRNELIVQAANTIRENTGLDVEIEKAELYASTSLFHKTPVVVSSIQTQCSGPRDARRYKRFRPDDFSTIIVDELHHATCPTWKEVIDYYMQNPNTKLLGVTATGDRSDGKGLGDIIESVAFKYGIEDAIRDGWLVDIVQHYVRVNGLDFSHIRTTAGDLNEGDLAKVMELEHNIQGICQPTLEDMWGLEPQSLSKIPVPQWADHLNALNKTPKRTIMFTVSVVQAEMCCNIFNRVMNGVKWVCGKTRDEDRQQILKDFSTGKVSAVVNVGILTEGYDNPNVELIVMGRPTKSRILYSQCIGRSTRPIPGIVDNYSTADLRKAAIAISAKPYARILDFVGNSGRHSLISSADILSSKVPDEVRERAKQNAIASGRPKLISKTISNAELELRREEEERRRREEAARKAHLVAKSRFHYKDVNPFGPNHSVPFTNRRSRDGKEFSEKQLKVLRHAGCDPSKLAYRQGQAIIAKQIKQWQEEKEARNGVAA